MVVAVVVRVVVVRVLVVVRVMLVIMVTGDDEMIVVFMYLYSH